MRLFGDNNDVLLRLAADVKARLASLPGTRNIGDNWGERTKKLIVRVDDVRARRAGITNQGCAEPLPEEARLQTLSRSRNVRPG